MSEQVAFVFIAQLADDPPLPPVLKCYEDRKAAILGAKDILTTIATRAEVKYGSISIGVDHGDGDTDSLGLWQLTEAGLWRWEAAE